MTQGSTKDRYIRIRGEQATPGMYVHALHCSWMDSPFWRQSFLLTKDADCARIRESVRHLTIDLHKGRGPARIAAVEPMMADTVRADSSVARPARAHRRKPPTDLERAAAMAERASAVIARLFDEARLGRAVCSADLTPLVEELAQATMRGNAAMVAVTRLKDRDRYTYIHSVAVGTLMMGLARHLGMSEADIRVAGMAGLLHDIGKVRIASAIVDKPGTLDPAELAQMRRHPDLGHDMLLDIADLDPRILAVCRHHHERIDGTGYPAGLAGDAIGPFVRLAAVCDVYDAVTSIRPYKRAWSPHEALARMLEWDGHFDPVILRALIASLGIQPFGALVRLHSNRLGIVVEEGDTPTTPIVRTFYDVPEQRRGTIVDVATTDDPILRAERGGYWFGDDWPTVRSEVMAASPPPAPVARRPETDDSARQGARPC